jgi:hypothetical protein
MEPHELISSSISRDRLSLSAPLERGADQLVTSGVFGQI